MTSVGYLSKIADMSLEAYQPTPADIANSKIRSGEFKLSGDQVFFTIQGEGQSIGKPAVFLRLHNCNLACSWCDTTYTWDKSSKEYWQEPQDWKIDRTVDEISKYSARRLVITGGEPLIQQKQIGQLIEAIPEWKVEIETNGTIFPEASIAERCQFNVSPKLSNSGNPLQKRYKPDVIRKFNNLPSTTFKFVVNGEEDLSEVDQMVSDCNLDTDKVIITPQGIRQDTIAEKALGMVDSVRDRGYRLLPRMHVMLWGNKRGI